MSDRNECMHEPMRTVLPVYEDSTIIGFRKLVLYESAEQFACVKCGAVLSTHIPDPEDLEYAVALARVQIPVRLNGQEIRFLRTVLELRAKDLARVLQVEDETVSRWEQGHKPIGPQTEKLLRLVVCAALADRVPAMSFDVNEIIQMNLRGPARPDVEIIIGCRRVSVVRQKDWRETTETMGWKMEPKIAA